MFILYTIYKMSRMTSKMDDPFWGGVAFALWSHWPTPCSGHSSYINPVMQSTRSCESLEFHIYRFMNSLAGTTFPACAWTCACKTLLVLKILKYKDVNQNQIVLSLSELVSRSRDYFMVYPLVSQKSTKKPSGTTKRIIESIGSSWRQLESNKSESLTTAVESNSHLRVSKSSPSNGIDHQEEKRVRGEINTG